MDFYKQSFIKKTDRISRIVERTFAKLPEIESDRARLLTESYRATENLPTIIRRAKAFEHILKNIPIVIRRKNSSSAVRRPKRAAVRRFPNIRTSGWKPSSTRSPSALRTLSIFPKRPRRS